MSDEPKADLESFASVQRSVPFLDLPIEVMKKLGLNLAETFAEQCELTNICFPVSCYMPLVFFAGELLIPMWKPIAVADLCDSHSKTVGDILGSVKADMTLKMTIR